MKKKFKNKIERLKDKKNIHLLLLGIILIVGAFFRFYNVANRYSLGDESVRDAIVGIQGARELQLPLTGPFSSFGPFTFGPWYWYQLIFFHLILPIPYSSWIYLGLLSLGYIIVMYLIGKELGNKWLGIIIASLVALSPAQLHSAAGLTNPNQIHLFVALSLLFFIKILKNDVPIWWGILLGVFIGIGINIHYQMFGYLIIPVLLLIFRYKKYQYFLATLVGIGLTFIPLLLFDLNNNWHTIRNIFFSYTSMKGRIYIPNSWTIYLRDFWPYFLATTLGVPPILGIFSFVLSGFVLGILFLRRKLSKPLVVFLLIFAFNFIYLRFYGGERFLGYVHYIQPFIFFMVGFLIWKISDIKYGKYVSIFLLIILLGIISQSSVKNLKSEPNIVNAYKTLEVLKQKYPKDQFTMYFCDGAHKGEPLTLLFLLDSHKMIGEKAHMIAIESPKCINTVDDSKYIQKSPVPVVRLNSLSSDELKKNNWKPLNFKDEYDTTVRWWFYERLE